jgi:hypothetical protein
MTICSDLREIPDICRRDFKETTAGRPPHALITR